MRQGFLMDNRATQFMGGSPGAVIFRLIVLSLIVGVILSVLEERLLLALLRIPGRVVDRRTLIADVWEGSPPGNPRALDGLVRSVRQRIRPLPLDIRTVRGRGHLVEVAADRAAPATAVGP